MTLKRFVDPYLEFGLVIDKRSIGETRKPTKEQEKPEIEEAELIIAKNRNGECCTIPTTFTGSRTMYEEKL